MSQDIRFQNIIWTNHALARVGHRGLSKSMVTETIQKADLKLAGKKPNTTELQKKYGHSIVTVIVTPNERGETIILSCWIDPPITGSGEWKDKQFDKEYKKATSWWRQLYLVLKRQLGA